jgi:hypothetical protein
MPKIGLWTLIRKYKTTEETEVSLRSREKNSELIGNFNPKVGGQTLIERFLTTEDIEILLRSTGIHREK